MDIKQLRYFVTVANEKQITRAAQKLCMAQPPLSRQIIELEKEIGKTLFIRTKYEMELTAAGKRLLQKAQDIIFQVDDLKYYVNDETPEKLSGVLKIGALMSCAPIFAQYLNIFSLIHPQVTYKLYEDTPANLLNLMYKREIELIFLRTPTFKAKQLTVVPLATESFSLAVPARLDPCPFKDNITLQEIAPLPLIMLHDGDNIGYNELFISAFATLDIKPNIICQCPNSSLALILVFSGLGATIMPQKLLQWFPNDSTHIKKITGLVPDTKPVMLFDSKRYLSPIAKQFLETMKNNI